MDRIRPKNHEEFIKDLEHLINRYNLDAYSNTPDFLLAQYMYTDFLNYVSLKEANDKWHGKDEAIPVALNENSAKQ